MSMRGAMTSVDCTTLVPSGAESMGRGVDGLYGINTVWRFIQEAQRLLRACVNVLGWFVGG